MRKSTTAVKAVEKCAWCSRMKLVLDGSTSPNTAGVKRAFARRSPVITSGNTDMPAVQSSQPLERAVFWLCLTAILFAWISFSATYQNNTLTTSSFFAAMVLPGISPERSAFQKIYGCFLFLPIRQKWILLNKSGRNSANAASEMKSLRLWIRSYFVSVIRFAPLLPMIFSALLLALGFYLVFIEE